MLWDGNHLTLELSLSFGLLWFLCLEMISEGMEKTGMVSIQGPVVLPFQKDHTVYINSSPHGSPEELLWGSEICQVSKPIWWRSPSKASDTCQRLSPTDMPNLQSLFQPQKPPIFFKQQCHFCDFFSLLLRWESDPPSHLDHFEDKLLICKAINPNDGLTYVLYYIIILPSSYPSWLRSHQIFTLPIFVRPCRVKA